VRIRSIRTASVGVSSYCRRSDSSQVSVAHLPIVA
jgi:hypothetical protein